MTNSETRDGAPVVQLMLGAVSTILATEGYFHLTGSSIAAAAGVPHARIYEYFSSVDELVEYYYSRKNYWHPLIYHLETYEINREQMFGPEAVSGFFRHMLGLFESETDLQQALYWEMNERHRIVDRVFAGREEAIAKLIALSKPAFKGSDVDCETIYRHCCQYLYRVVVLSYVPAAVSDETVAIWAVAISAGPGRKPDIKSEAGRQLLCSKIDHLIRHVFRKAGNLRGA